MVHFNYNGLSESSGVYLIFNNHNWRVYVGSAKRFHTRWKYGHLGSLLNNKHQNKFLQADFVKCKQELGHDDFLEFHVLQNMPGSTREERLSAEDNFLKIHFDTGKQCYNLTATATSREGSFDKNQRETSEKISAALKRFYLDSENRKKQSLRLKGIPKIKRSEEHRKKISLFKAGKLHSEETKKKMSESHKTESALEKLRLNYEKHKISTIEAQRKAVSKKHILITPDGETIEVFNLNKFCRENGLKSSGFSNLLRLKRKKYKGWGYVGSISNRK